MARRSPIKDPPLRAPGQSLDEHRVDVVLDGLLAPSIAALFLVTFWLYDLWRSYRDVPPMPWLTGTIALTGVAYAAWRLRKALPLLRNLRLARDGERAVGHGLEHLRTLGYAVYHDIQGEDFNVDHVLIGPAGIFAIETKTWSKPTDRDVQIAVDGDVISIGTWRPSRDPVAQARAQAAWIEGLLKRSTGRVFPVTPVIVFPGWWVETKSRPTRLWVLNDKALPSFLSKEPARMTEEGIAMAKTHFELLIRGPIEAR